MRYEFKDDNLLVLQGGLTFKEKLARLKNKIIKFTTSSTPSVPSIDVVAADYTFDVQEDGTISDDLKLNSILGNEPSVFNLISDVSHGILVLNTDGTFTYTPTVDFFGTDSFQYSIVDSQMKEDIGVVSFNVIMKERTLELKSAFGMGYGTSFNIYTYGGITNFFTWTFISTGKYKITLTNGKTFKDYICLIDISSASTNSNFSFEFFIDHLDNTSAYLYTFQNSVGTNYFNYIMFFEYSKVKLARYKIFQRIFFKDATMILSKNVSSYTTNSNMEITLNSLSTTKKGTVFPYTSNKNYFYHISTSPNNYYYCVLAYKKSYSLTQGIYYFGTTNYFFPTRNYFLSLYQLDVSDLYTQLETSFSDIFLKYDRTDGIKFKSSHFSSVSILSDKIIIYTNQDLSLRQFNINIYNYLDQYSSNFCYTTLIKAYTDRIEIKLNNANNLVNYNNYSFELINFEDPA
jgi:hypothetical protein